MTRRRDRDLDRTRTLHAAEERAPVTPALFQGDFPDNDQNWWGGHFLAC